MKIQSILTSRIPLQESSLEQHSLESTVGKFKVKYTLFQESRTQHEPATWYSPADSRTHVGDVVKVTIDELVLVSSGYSVPDIEFSFDFPYDQNDIHKFTNMMISMGDDHYHDEDKDEYNRFVGYAFHNDPALSEKIFDAISDEAGTVHNGEI